MAGRGAVRKAMQARVDRQSERVADATRLMLDAAGAEGFDSARRERLVEMAIGELKAISGGEQGLARAGRRLREAASASSFPQLQRGRRNGDTVDDDSDDLEERDFPAAKRKRMAKAGTAMPDGSFPIANAEDLANARRLAGKSKSYSKAQVMAHIRKRARALGIGLDEADDEPDDDHDDDALDEDASLADRLARAGRQARRQQESDILARVVGASRLREAGGRTIDVAAAMGIDRDSI